jgi:DNA-directed RNA polymerase
MYFPHNMDFRGRAYPIPPTLNHLGNDLCRGLLQFDVAKPLGPSGYRWLKIHLANLHGYDKHSFTERENYVMENMDNIFDSADKPLNGNKWWLKSEDPWQCLSACYEVAAAVRSGDPESFPSRLPIHQDGTCNGLQHYAALGGDLAGAQAVNLAPSDRPADVYTGVAEMVNKLVDEEAAQGHPDALMLQGKISRKIVKQTVMTNVYGVTFVGARQQIESRLKERDDIPSAQVYHLAGYLAKKVFASLGEMFNGARQIQDWLTDSARRIAKSIPEETVRALDVSIGEGFKADTHEDLDQTAMEYTIGRMQANANKKKSFSARNPSANQMTSVVWTTPLGLPIVQPYRRVGKRQVSTLLQTVFIEDPDASCPVNSHKQSTAFPPNFIHSLDATHMLMSAVACQDAGLAFASVHDSYWTHAADVDTMNKVIRDQFIELHKQPIMENLRSEFIERYRGYKVPVSREVPNANSKKAVAKVEAGKLSSPEAAHKEVISMGFASEDVVRQELEEMKKKNSDENELATIFGVDGGEDEDGDEENDEDPELSASARRGKKFAHSWEELSFLPLPEKGEFDIQQVKESDYFFH